MYLQLCLIGFGQSYQDHFGLGNVSGIEATSSPTTMSHGTLESVSGSNNIPSTQEASRFLTQCGFGGDISDITKVQNLGVENWIDWQIQLPYTSYHEKYIENYQIATSLLENTNQKREYLSYSFYDIVLSNPDVLRHKQAFTLSQIFVISPTNSMLGNLGYANSSYYDILYQNAFSNFRDLLEKITLHPAMGIFLSHFQNEKSDPIAERYPDENYAREILQLFTIGIHLLNIDGTEKLDDNQQPIASYSSQDIQELAKVFTGYSGGLAADNSNPTFFGNVSNYNLTVPMKAYQNSHDKSEKKILSDIVISFEQTAEFDLSIALDYIFNHPNVGPHISRLLIQQYVTSNPSTDYIKRVAQVFNNNGKGIRGDLSAVIKAILLDPEARDCNIVSNPKSGRLLQPIERIIQLFKFLDISTPSGMFWYKDENDLYSKVEQSFLGSPTVFNFFTPEFAEESVLKNDMVSPEFQLLNSTTAIHYINLIENALKVAPFNNKTSANAALSSMANNDNDKPTLNMSEELQVFQNVGLSGLIDHINTYLCRGQLSTETRNLIFDSVSAFLNHPHEYTNEDAVNDVIYFVMTSPDYLILK